MIDPVELLSICIHVASDKELSCYLSMAQGLNNIKPRKKLLFVRQRFFLPKLQNCKKFTKIKKVSKIILTPKYIKGIIKLLNS